MSFSLENRSGYDARDLRRFFARGLRALGIRKHIEIVVVTAPARSRGCATVRGNRMVIAIASPSNFRLRRLARLLIHEGHHLLGQEHADMDERTLYSLGPVPEWAKGLTFRYRGRAEDQMGRLESRRFPRPILKNW